MSATGEYHGLGEATAAGRVREAIDKLGLRWHQYQVALAELADYNGPVPDVHKAEDALLLAARDLTNVVDDMPQGQRPEGWALDGDVTA